MSPPTQANDVRCRGIDISEFNAGIRISFQTIPELIPGFGKLILESTF